MRGQYLFQNSHVLIRVTIAVEGYHDHSNSYVLLEQVWPFWSRYSHVGESMSQMVGFRFSNVQARLSAELSAHSPAPCLQEESR